ncbi:MAG: SurA N-terminal domain-containing protein [Campylobacterota bacterium]|nr:SurA N-terminal domain-containing protein [Campylobacterota bacterium]
MITWMQRHKKYLIITMWISTIAFIGAGFVGWGQYSYGDKATAIAKVGEVPISNADLQKSYSRLYAQYAQMFQGNFDEEKAKQFGLQKQAIRQLIDQALILNLAKSYKLRVSDEELLKEIQTQTVFHNNGTFDKDVYQKTLKQNRLSMREYEEDVKKSMLISKVFKIFNPSVLSLEKELINSAMGIEDKISYKILDNSMVTVDSSHENINAYWEMHKSNFMTLPSYKTSLIKQEFISADATDEAIQTYYNENKHDFKDSEGAILELESARDLVVKALNEKASKKEALKKYIAFKKGKLDDSIEIQHMAIDSANNIFGPAIFKEITELTTAKPFLKPRKVGNAFMILKLDALEASTEKSFDQAKDEVTLAYNSSETTRLLQELAQNSTDFSGDETEFVSRESVSSIEGLSPQEASEFINAIFDKQDKQGFVELSDKKIVLYNILEQQLLNKSITEEDKNVIQMKTSLLNRGLVQLLESKYPVEMFVKGL